MAVYMKDRGKMTCFMGLVSTLGNGETSIRASFNFTSLKAREYSLLLTVADMRDISRWMSSMVKVLCTRLMVATLRVISKMAKEMELELLQMLKGNKNR